MKDCYPLQLHHVIVMDNSPSFVSNDFSPQVPELPVRPKQIPEKINCNFRCNIRYWENINPFWVILI